MSALQQEEKVPMKVATRLLVAASVCLALLGCGGGSSTYAPVAVNKALTVDQLPDDGRAALHLFIAINGSNPCYDLYSNYVSLIQGSGPQGFALSIGPALAAVPDDALASVVLENLGITTTTLNVFAYDALRGALTQLFGVHSGARVVVILNLANILTGLETNEMYGGIARSFNERVVAAYAYSSDPTNICVAQIPQPPCCKTTPGPNEISRFVYLSGTTALAGSRSLVIRDQGNWETFWSEHNAGSTPIPPWPSAIDFTSTMLAGAVVDVPNDCYFVYSRRLLWSPDVNNPERIEVQYHIQPPAGGCVATQSPVSKVFLDAMPMSALPIRFVVVE